MLNDHSLFCAHSVSEPAISTKLLILFPYFFKILHLPNTCLLCARCYLWRKEVTAGLGDSLGIWIWEGFLSYTARVAHCAWTFYINTIASLKYLLSFWESGILVTVRQKVPTWLALNKKPGWHLSLYWASQVDIISHMLPRFLADQSAPLCDHPGKRTHGSQNLVSSRLHSVPFPFADYTFYSFVVNKS